MREDIKEAMSSIIRIIKQKCSEQGHNGEDIFFLAVALKEIESVRATLPKEFLDS